MHIHVLKESHKIDIENNFFLCLNLLCRLFSRNCSEQEDKKMKYIFCSPNGQTLLSVSALKFTRTYQNCCWERKVFLYWKTVSVREVATGRLSSRYRASSLFNLLDYCRWMNVMSTTESRFSFLCCSD